MAKGQESKSIITKKILDTFSGSFLYNDGKEIRIPLIEGGEEIQIKVTLTCAKENVTVGADSVMPGDFPAPKTQAPTPVSTEPVKVTDAEKANVAQLLASLGL